MRETSKNIGWIVYLKAMKNEPYLTAIKKHNLGVGLFLSFNILGEIL